MQLYLEKFLLAFIPLFVAIDPVGLVAIYLGLGGHVDEKRRRHEGTLGLITSLAPNATMRQLNFGLKLTF